MYLISSSALRGIVFIGTVSCAIYCLYASQSVADLSETLYLLTAPNGLPPSGVPYTEMLSVDPVSSKIKKVIRIGYSADFAVSPDGKLAYITSSYEPTPELGRQPFIETYDTSSGSLVSRIPNPDGQQFTSAVHRSPMLMAPSGNWLYITKMAFTSKDYSFYLTAFDTSKQSFLSAREPLYGCKAPTLIASENDLEVSAVCVDSTYARRIIFRPGLTTRRISRPFPDDFTASGLAVVIPHTDSGAITFISQANGALSLDPNTGRFSKYEANFHFDEKMYLHRALVAKSLHRDFFGMNDAGNEGLEFRHLVSIDDATGATLNVVDVPPFFDMALSKDERTVYLLSPSRSEVNLLDSSTMMQKKVISLPGRRPFSVCAR